MFLLRLPADHRGTRAVHKKFWSLRCMSIALSTLLFLLSFPACSPPSGQGTDDASVATGDLTALHPDVRGAAKLDFSQAPTIPRLGAPPATKVRRTRRACRPGMASSIPAWGDFRATRARASLATRRVFGPALFGMATMSKVTPC